MRIALISDIHGNATAFEAVIGDMAHQSVDSVVCLGDIATLGPEPGRSFQLLEDLDCPCILGNHDEALLHADRMAALCIGETTVESVVWCSRGLSESNVALLHGCQPTFGLQLSQSISLLCCHGSPRSNVQSIRSETPPDELDTLISGSAAQVIASGHTHVQLLRQHRGVILVNPGSVGCAFSAPSPHIGGPKLLAIANYAIVGSNGGGISVELRTVPYDSARYLAVLKRSELPMKEWWISELMLAQ